MPNLWRISQYVDLAGEGGRRRANRWNSAGRPVVYLGETVASVLLERLVHLLDDRQLPTGLQLILVQYPETIGCTKVVESDMATNWRTNMAITQAAGDQWLTQGETALLRVPSAVIPHTANFLLNPEHAEAPLFSITEHLDFALDHRLKQLADFAFSYREEIPLVLTDE